MADPTTTSGAIAQATQSTSVPTRTTYGTTQGPRPWDSALAEYQRLAAQEPALKAKVDAARAKLDALPTRGTDPQIYASIEQEYSRANQALLDFQQHQADVALNIGKLAEDYREHDPAAMTPKDIADINSIYTAQAYNRAQAENLRQQMQIDQAKASYEQAVQGNLPPEEVAARQAALDQATVGSKQAQATVDAITAANAGALQSIGIQTAAANAALAQTNVGIAGSQATTEAAKAARARDAVGADIDEAVARGELTQAQADEARALLPSRLDLAQQQVEAAKLANASVRQQTHQAAIGDVATKIEQFQQAINAGTMTEAQADAALRDTLVGSTAFQRQQQREAQLATARGQALQYGIAVQRGQRYLPSAEPGGGYAQAFQNLGVPGFQSVELHPQSLVQDVQAGGIQTAEMPPPAYFQGGKFVGAPAPAAAVGAPSPQHLPVEAVGPNDPSWTANAPAPTAATTTPAAGGGTFVPRALALLHHAGSRRLVHKPSLFAQHPTVKPAVFARGGR